MVCPPPAPVARGGQYNAANKEVIPASAITKTWNGNYWTMSFSGERLQRLLYNLSGKQYAAAVESDCYFGS